MGNRSKDENAATSNNTRDRDQESNSRDQDTRDASLARIIAEAVAQQTKSIVEAVSRQKSEETQALTDVFQRQMEETRAQYQELLKASCAQKLSSTLKVTSGTNGFRVMDAFDWTNDKNIYQRWQLWSHKARLALDAMEGDNEKTKISYLHHWLDGKGIDKIKGWTNSKILIPQEEYDALEERDRKGRYSSDKIELLFVSRKHLDSQVKPFVSRGRTTPDQARFYDFSRVSHSNTGNCEKMPFSKPSSRG